MKKILEHLTVTSYLYLIVYVIYCYCTWSISNPFLWICNIPTYTTEDRGMLLVASFIINGAIVMITMFIKDVKARKA